MIFLSLENNKSIISYKLNSQLRNLNTYYILNYCLFGSVKLTKNADLDKYKCSVYGIGLDSRSKLLFTDGYFGKKCNYFWTCNELICAY